ncbi:heavy-metal-associated domain-containing protein [Variovorax sp. RT4R15]|uniref:heavy-metal-associated domain-containing protein n=1 Tax=Variovorax sp. RT4R15 TaxID=3443737 RepID=UPI003F477686
MVTFQVPDMTCGHCASSITKAVAGVDKTAITEVDIPQKLVRISGNAPADALAHAIEQAGYTPQEVRFAPTAGTATPRASGGCCGGTRKTASIDAGQAAAPATRSCCGK